MNRRTVPSSCPSPLPLSASQALSTSHLFCCCFLLNLSHSLVSAECIVIPRNWPNKEPQSKSKGHKQTNQVDQSYQTKKNTKTNASKRKPKIRTTMRPKRCFTHTHKQTKKNPCTLDKLCPVFQPPHHILSSFFNLFLYVFYVAPPSLTLPSKSPC